MSEYQEIELNTEVSTETKGGTVTLSFDYLYLKRKF